MASMIRDENGSTTFYLTCPDGKRRPLRIGKQPKKTADAFKVKLERLESCRKIGIQPEAELVAWISGLSEKHSDWLRKNDFISHESTKRVDANITLARITSGD